MRAIELSSQHMMENITVVHKQTILITGGARGLGRAIVNEFAMQKDKYNICINYNQSQNQANSLANSLEKEGVSCLLFKADISNENEVIAMVNAIKEKFGKIDILVNNSAICKDSIFYEKSAEDFRQTLDVNVVGTFLISKYVGELMLKNKFGKIINITSTNGINTYFPMCIDYDASKSAIISLTHNLAVQFAPYVNVNAVAPGFITTESEVQDMDEEFIRLEEEKILLHRAGKPEEVAKLVHFLASNEANFINNQVIKINGGMYGDV